MHGPSRSRLAFTGVLLLCCVPVGAFVVFMATREPVRQQHTVAESRQPVAPSPRQPVAAPPRQPDPVPAQVVLEEEKSSAAPDEEQAVIDELRRLQFDTPEKSLELARSALARFPDGPTVAERSWYEARALVSLGRFADARRVAEWMLDHHPESPFTADARRHLLSHPFGLPAR